MMSIIGKFSTLIISLLLASCVVGPNYVRPGVKLPDKFKEAKGKAFKAEPPPKGWKLASPCDDIKRGEWWEIFQDPTLNRLEDELNHCNLTIMNAWANYSQSLAIVDEARASFFPTLIGTFNLFRQKFGGGGTSFFTTSGVSTTTGTAASGAIAKSATVTTYSTFLVANWEPDIWGQVRRTVEGDAATAQSNQALLAATRLSAQGSLAQYYFELRALDTDQKLLNDTVIGYKTALQLTRNQYAAGVASRADIVQAQSQLETAQAQAINNGILRGQYEHAIAVLIGRPPANFSLPFNPLRTPPPTIPVTVPSVWLERRPDVAQAERLMQQANAQIGIAIAAYFPTLNLTANISAAGRSLHQLITHPSVGWSAGMQLAETIFDGGLRNATVKAAKAGYNAQVASYRQTILTALQDVEDNLIALRLLKEQSVAQNAAAASAKTALQLVINQYKSGVVPYSSIIVAQIAAYNAQKAAYDVVGLQMTAAVGLVKSLGGGWRTRDICPIRIYPRIIPDELIRPALVVPG
ncbi:outer membrane efflux protein [Legionella nautarum]|uniref:Outer membrane efflux protein n=1 Tax=Legionella nautarum TaxID=45070 RepID=A0A0W0X1S9_9GAMM|nr:efflux transporter outer membrane subunit [Legionella nautarum]KTD38517.1 outer membrane efflux protein [Legionella nautarum]